MNLNNEQFGTELHHTLAAIGENCTVKAIDLGDYETSYEVTKHDSDRKLYITPVENDLIDMILYDTAGTTIASCTLFNKAVTDITPEELATLITICL